MRLGATTVGFIKGKLVHERISRSNFNHGTGGNCNAERGAAGGR